MHRARASLTRTAFVTCKPKETISRKDPSTNAASPISQSNTIHRIFSTSTPKVPLIDCIGCLTNTTALPLFDSDGEVQVTAWKIYDFCHTSHPNVYDFLIQMLAFVNNASSFQATQPPLSLPHSLTTITTLSASFSPTPGMNAPSSIPTGIPRPGPTHAGPLSWWETRLIPGVPVPTQYLAQVPAGWPYGVFGAGRGKQDVTSTVEYALVNPMQTARTVAWVAAEVSWRPRPLVGSREGVTAGGGK